VPYVTRGLLDALLERARADDPTPVNCRLSATEAGAFEPPLELAETTPVMTHFVPSFVGESVNAVFGVDLGAPVGRGGARFLSHPTGRLTLSKADDLAGVVIVAVPPYDRESVAAFDRAGVELDLTVIDAAPPAESLPE